MTAYNNTQPAFRAFFSLTDLHRELGHLAASRFALTWLAAARMSLTGNVNGLKSLGELATAEGWQAVKEAGLPIDAIEYISTSSRKADAVALGARAVAIVAELVTEAGDQPWDVLPALSTHYFSVGRMQDGAFQHTPALADLLLDLVGDSEEGDVLWLPFDESGVQTVQALRRGWAVNGSLMLGAPGHLLPLLLAIEFGTTSHSKYSTDVSRDKNGHWSLAATHVLATPPFGVKTQDIPSVTQWGSSSGLTGYSYARLEAWAIDEILHRVTKRAVFCVSPGVLFSGGQEQRLRENLVERGSGRNQLEAVIATPTKVFANTNLGAGIVVVALEGGDSATRVVDLGAPARNQAEAERILREGSAVALGQIADEQKARHVSLDEIRSNGFLLAPNRYLSTPVEVGPNAVPLKDLCTAIRPPALSRDGEGIDVFEMGVPELGQWQAFEGPFKKGIQIKSKARVSTFLQQGDVILSVKGAVGRVGLVGELADKEVVVAQSCVALRLSDAALAQNVTPEYLLMYLRSDDAMAQLQGLEVGSAMTHVPPATLLESFRLPLPAAQVRDAVQRDYLELCSDEMKIQELQEQMEARRRRRWGGS